MWMQVQTEKKNRNVDEILTDSLNIDIFCAGFEFPGRFCCPEFPGCQFRIGDLLEGPSVAADGSPLALFCVLIFCSMVRKWEAYMGFMGIDGQTETKI